MKFAYHFEIGESDSPRYIVDDYLSKKILYTLWISLSVCIKFRYCPCHMVNGIVLEMGRYQGEVGIRKSMRLGCYNTRVIRSVVHGRD